MRLTFAAVVSLGLFSCGTDAVSRDVAPQRQPSPGARGTAASDGGEVRYVDTHDHFAHTTAGDKTRPAYFKRRGAAQEIALTFDCAWVPDDAGAAVLDALKEMNVKSTFFVAGPFVAGPRRAPNEATLRLVRRIVEEGHEVGNHTMTHPHATPRVVWRDELVGLRDAWSASVARAFAGAEPPRAATMTTMWRAPYGEYDERSLRDAALAGYTSHVGWSVDVHDALGLPDCRVAPADPSCLDAAKETAMVSAFARRSPEQEVIVVLAHLGAPYGFGKDPRGIRALVAAMRAEGRTFAKISEVLAPP